MLPPDDRTTESRARQARPRILVVEDNVALAENVAELFSEIGAETTLCGDAASALAFAAESPFDLAIVDMRLPEGVRGVDLIPELRRAAPNGEVIVVTGSATLDTAIAAVREGVFAYVQKPFDPDDLIALGERALTQVQLRYERSALARELARSEALYRGLVQSVDALILGLDAEARIVFANRAAADTVGRDAVDLIGRVCHQVFASEAEDRRRCARAIQRAAEGAITRDFELALGDGPDARLVVWTLTPIRTEATGGPVVLVTGTDVTERRALERRTAEVEAMAAMGELTTGLAHEIRNPLNAANLQLELLSRRVRRAGAEDQFGEPIRLVQDELRRLSRLAEEFLNLARPRQLARRHLAIEDLVAEVVEAQRPLAEAGGVEVVLETEPDLPRVEADDGRVRQVLVNLIGNAFEAMRAQPERRLTIATRREGGSVAVEVRDTGPGIPAAIAGELFRPFVTTKEAGTGLGLPIVKRIVELHGGSVRVGPSAGGGTVARFTLPIHARPA